MRWCRIKKPTQWVGLILAILMVGLPYSVRGRSSILSDDLGQRSKWDSSLSPMEASFLPPLPPTRPDSRVVPSWQQLQQEAMGELKAFWHADTGTPAAIYGLMADLSAQMHEPEAAARAFLGQWTGLFRIDSPADLQLIKSTASLTGHHIFFQQTYRGLPVFGGMIAVHIDRAGRVHSLANSYRPEIFLPTTQPSIGAEIVYARMLEALRIDAQQISLLSQPEQELVVYVRDGEPHLAWKVTIPTESPLGTWEAFGDAHTGELLSEPRDRNYYAEGRGRIFVPNAVAATAIDDLDDENDNPDAVPESAYTIVTLLDLNESGFLDGPFVSTRLTSNRVRRASLDFTDLHRGDDGFEEVETYWAIDTSQRYIQSFEIDTAANYSIRVDVHGTSADNSFFRPQGNGTGALFMGCGGVDDAEDAEIIWHEYGHAILDNQVPNIDQNYDGMGEGFADYWAATMSTQMVSADRAKYDPAVGEWDATSYNPGKPPYLRRVDTDARYPEGRHKDPHITGLIWSRALWEIHQLIGREAADRIILEGNFLLPFRPLLPEAAQAMLQADRIINDGAHQKIMRTVFAARGLIEPGGPIMVITSPNGGESWPVGSVQTISWVSSNVNGNVRIRLSRFGGILTQTIFENTPNTGSVQWTVTGPISFRCQIEIASIADPTINDMSDEIFSIVRRG